MSDYTEMRAISVRQPWAHLIIHGPKDIENRTWATKIRGRVLIHASSAMSRREYAFVKQFAAQLTDFELPSFEDLQRGGIIGSVEISDCVQHSASPWFGGPFGLVLRDPKPLPFHLCRGWLGFFKQRLPALPAAEQPA